MRLHGTACRFFGRHTYDLRLGGDEAVFYFYFQGCDNLLTTPFPSHRIASLDPWPVYNPSFLLNRISGIVATQPSSLSKFHSIDTTAFSRCQVSQPPSARCTYLRTSTLANMIEEKWRYWGPSGDIRPNGPSSWHIGDWDQRRTISVITDWEQDNEDLAIGKLVRICDSEGS